MAYKTKFLHFKTKDSYNAERAKTTAGTEERKVFDAYISFIDEGPMIRTWGKEYKCDISASEVEALVNAGKISPATVAPLIAGTAAVGTSTKYAREDHRHPEQVNITGNAATATTATNLASAPSFIKNGNFIKITVGNKTSTDFTVPYASKTSAAETLMYGRNIILDGDVTGSTSESFNGSKNVTINTTISTINAEKLTGTIDANRLPEIPIEKIPAAALERLFVVDSQSAAMSLTIQEGDVVQIGSGGPMYFCVSESASTFATKFKEFTAGSATSVPWSGVTGKPTFATVATSGSYNDLTNKPTIPSLSGYVTQNWVTSQGYLTSIPAATSSTYGGIQIGYTTSGRNYAVQLSNGKAYVNVPWTDTNITYRAGTNISISGTTINCTYTLPTASSSVLGGIQIGYTTSGRNYAVQLSNGKAYVNVPWTDTNITYRAGTNISISGTTINCTYTLPTASSSVLGGVKVGSNITLSSGTISLSKSNVTSALGYTPANTSDIPEIPIALPNPNALTINGTSYTGSSAVSISTSKPLSVGMLTSSTVDAGYSYSCDTSKVITTLNGFSSTNPDSVIISSAKLKFTASNVIKMDGLDDLSGTYYIYCLSYMANGKIAVNGAVYA